MTSLHALHLPVVEMHKDLVADILMELGVDNFVYGSSDCDLHPDDIPPGQEAQVYEQFAVPDSPMVIYSSSYEELEQLKEQLLRLLPQRQITLKTSDIAITSLDDSWQESWKESFQPICLGTTFAIVPPWEAHNTFPCTHKLIINPGMAFGTGQHETTQLCLEALTAAAPFESCLDVGTGSGILSLGAKQLGATTVVGQDIDPNTIPIAQANAEMNEIEGILFTAKPLAQLEYPLGFFDVVVANIQYKPLILLLPELVAYTKVGGRLILSGLLLTDLDFFLPEIHKFEFLILQEQRNQKDWCVLICERTN